MASNFTLVNDLKADALFRAGESTSGSSSFDDKVLDYLNWTQQALLNGGGIAVGRDLATSAGIYAHLVDIPTTDWWWARKQPRGVLTTDALIETGTATVTEGSTTATFSSAPARSVAGWRLEVAKLPTVPRILSHEAGSTTAVMDAPWPEDTQTAATYVLFNVEYTLPGDFLRFAGSPYLHSRYLDPIPVSSRETHDASFPPRTFFREPPTAAARLQPQLIQLNSYDIRSYRMEFDYIFMLPELQIGGRTVIPPHQSAVLAIGAAMRIAFDKNDDRADNLASEYREMVQRMCQEHRKDLSSGSMTFGVHRARLDKGSNRKGRIQPKGETFLV